mmetsp:Transcript_12323/g.18678  ORF Transcript_12323/g.18678 Transcript_12323/m.18678 type:complete len:334 (-) Transcript_12323:175-1176(-)
MSSQSIRYNISHIRSLTEQALLKAGFNREDAAISTDILMYAELRGNNQGLIKLVSGALQPNPNATDITVVRESKLTAKLDGGQRIGMAVVAKAVDMVIEKTSQHGIAAIACSNYSSATGALGGWVKRIASAGYVGIVMCQCPEMVAPYGSYEAIFGTNPIAIGLPTAPRHQVLDMATSAEAWFGLVTSAAEGKPIPDDIAYDAQGNATTSAADALKGALRVFDRSYKGSHLALMIELLAGAMSGAAMENKTESKNWGSLVIALDPNEFGTLEDFQERAAVMCDRVKNSRKLPGVENIYLPGERGDEVEAKNLETGTVEIPVSVYEQLCANLNS